MHRFIHLIYLSAEIHAGLENTGLGSLYGFHSTLVFNISSNAFENLDVSEFGSPIDSANAIMPGPNLLSVELYENGSAVPLNSIKLLNISMEIINSDTTAGLSWDETNTALFKNDNSSIVILELLGSDNSNLPISENEINFGNQFYFNCFPNPISQDGSLNIQLRVKVRSKVEISIYNLKGQLVKILYNKVAPSNENFELNWNYTSHNNEIISAGIYFCALKIRNKIRGIKKLYLLNESTLKTYFPRNTRKRNVAITKFA